MATQPPLLAQPRCWLGHGVDDLAFAVYRVANGLVVATFQRVHAVVVGRVELGLEAGDLVRLQRPRKGFLWGFADARLLWSFGHVVPSGVITKGSVCAGKEGGRWSILS